MYNSAKGTATIWPCIGCWGVLCIRKDIQSVEPILFSSTPWLAIESSCPRRYTCRPGGACLLTEVIHSTFAIQGASLVKFRQCFLLFFPVTDGGRDFIIGCLIWFTFKTSLGARYVCPAVLVSPMKSAAL